MVGNRELFGQSLEADHLAHTLLAKNAFFKGLPEHGAYPANDLEALIMLHAVPLK